MDIDLQKQLPCPPPKDALINNGEPPVISNLQKWAVKFLNLPDEPGLLRRMLGNVRFDEAHKTFVPDRELALIGDAMLECTLLPFLLMSKYSFPGERPDVPALTRERDNAATNPSLKDAAERTGLIELVKKSGVRAEHTHFPTLVEATIGGVFVELGFERSVIAALRFFARTQGSGSPLFEAARKSDGAEATADFSAAIAKACSQECRKLSIERRESEIFSYKFRHRSLLSLVTARDWPRGVLFGEQQPVSYWLQQLLSQLGRSLLKLTVIAELHDNPPCESSLGRKAKEAESILNSESLVKTVRNHLPPSCRGIEAAGYEDEGEIKRIFQSSLAAVFIDAGCGEDALKIVKDICVKVFGQGDAGETTHARRSPKGEG